MLRDPFSTTWVLASAAQALVRSPFFKPATGTPPGHWPQPPRHWCDPLSSSLQLAHHLGTGRSRPGTGVLASCPNAIHTHSLCPLPVATSFLSLLGSGGGRLWCARVGVVPFLCLVPVAVVCGMHALVPCLFVGASGPCLLSLLVACRPPCPSCRVVGVWFRWCLLRANSYQLVG